MEAGLIYKEFGAGSACKLLKATKR